MSDQSTGILRFLIEFRKRTLISLLMFAVIFSFLLFFSNQLYTWLAHPLLKFLPQGHGLIATAITAPFFVPFELAFYVALFFSVPIFLYQLWRFVAPALYQHEKKFLWPLMSISIGLFYLGLAFAYFIVFPILFRFLTHASPYGVFVSPDISQYLDFTLKLFFIFGMIFEVPVVLLLLIWTRVVTRSQLIKFRPYAIISAFVIALLLAPPDVLSQTLLALPLWLLYEAGILFSFWLRR